MLIRSLQRMAGPSGYRHEGEEWECGDDEARLLIRAGAAEQAKRPAVPTAVGEAVGATAGTHPPGPSSLVAEAAAVMNFLPRSDKRGGTSKR